MRSPKTRGTTLEKLIQSKILAYLRDNSIFCYKTITCNVRGIPDICFIYKGHTFHCEVKTMQGMLSNIQKYQMSKILKSGGYPVVVRTLSEVKYWLSCIDELDDKSLHKLVERYLEVELDKSFIVDNYSNVENMP